MRSFLLAVLALLAPAARADTILTGDWQVTGQVGVGTAIPRARLEVKVSTADAYGVRVSSADGAALMTIQTDGKVAVGSGTAVGRVDIRGTGAGGETGALMRVGNSSSSATSAQVVFASTGAYGYAHAIRTRATAGQNLGNAVDFYIWLDTAQPTAMGTWNALSLAAVPYASTGSVHVNPVGTADVELEVSDGTTTGGGTILRAAAVSPSSRSLKKDIAALGAEGRAKAYADLKSLRHARYRYKTQKAGTPLTTGLIYEDAPESVRGSGRTVVFDARVALLEAALQEAATQIAELERKVVDLESRRGR